MIWSKIKAKIKGWRTVVWNSIVGVSGILLYLADNLQMVDWSKVFSPAVVGCLMVGLAVAGIVLRLITTSALGKK